MKRTLHIVAFTAALLAMGASVVAAQPGRRGGGPSHSDRGYSDGNRAYRARPYSGGNHYYDHRSYTPPPRNYYNRRGPGAYVDGRFYANRGYYYGGSFYARPYFGFGIAIPFGYGYSTRLGCGYYDGWGRYHPAPCYYPDEVYYYRR